MKGIKEILEEAQKKSRKEKRPFYVVNTKDGYKVLPYLPLPEYKVENGDIFFIRFSAQAERFI